MESSIDHLFRFLSRARRGGPAPAWWIGAGVSDAGGMPTMRRLEPFLRADLPPTGATGFALVRAYLDEYGPADLVAAIGRQWGEPRAGSPIHESLARLAAHGGCGALVTTNPDRWLEAAMKAAGVPFQVRVATSDEADTAGGGESGEEGTGVGTDLIRIDAGTDDWREAVRDATSLDRFQRTTAGLHQALELSLRRRPVVFLGCSMRDPRLLDWLRGLSDAARRDLFASRAVVTRRALEALSDGERALLASANVKLLPVEDAAAVEVLMVELAARLEALTTAPPPADPALGAAPAPGEADPRSRASTPPAAPAAPSPLAPEFDPDRLLEQAGTLSAQGRHGEAVPLLEQAVALIEVRHGAHHPSLCAPLTGLALARAALGQPAEAEPALRRALEAARAAFGPRHADTAQILTMLAQLEAVLHRPEASATAYEALESLHTALGPDHPVTQSAAPMLEAILERTPITLNTDPSARSLVERFQAGLRAFQAGNAPEALVILTEVSGEARAQGAHTLEASACGLLAQILFVGGSRAEAAGWCRRALELSIELNQGEAVVHFRQLLDEIEAAGQGGL